MELIQETKNDKKNSNPHVKNEDTKDETVEVSESSVAKDSAGFHGSLFGN